MARKIAARKPIGRASSAKRRIGALMNTTLKPKAPPAPVITTESLPDGVDGEPYSETLEQDGEAGGTWSVEAGAATLTAIGLSLDASTGEISGTHGGDAQSGLAEFTVRYTDPYGQWDDQDLSIAVPPIITTEALDPAEVGVEYSATIETTDPECDIEITGGALPDGITLVDNGDGTASLEGTPTESGAFNVTVTATGPGGSDEQELTLTVDPSELTFGDVFTGSDEDPFVDDNWTIELYTGGNVQLLSNRLRTSNSTGGDGLNMLWYDGQQIPADWVTITVEVAAEFAAAVFCNAAIALCMDDPPTGNATHSGASSLQNGYAVEYRRGGFEEIVTRFHGGARTNLHNAEVSELNTGARPLKVVFTKMVDRIRMEIYYDDALIATVDDTDANRKTGACYVGLGSYAPSTNYVYFDDFDVTVTF